MPFEVASGFSCCWPPVLVDQGARGDEDTGPLLQRTLHLGKEIGVELLQSLIVGADVELGEASSEVDQCLHGELRQIVNKQLKSDNFN